MYLLLYTYNNKPNKKGNIKQQKGYITIEKKKTTQIFGFKMGGWLYIKFYKYKTQKHFK